MRNRNLMIALGAVIVVIILAVGIRQSQQASPGNEIRVGAVFNLTGPTAFWGTQVQSGMDLALAEESSTGQVPIKVIYEDAQGKPQLVISAFQKLNDVDRVSMVVSCLTPVSQPLRPLAEKANLPLLATIMAGRDFGKDQAWCFRDFLTQDQMAGPMAEYASNKLGAKTAAALLVDDDFGRDGGRVFKETFQRHGGTWLGEDTFAQAATDVRGQTTKIASRHPDAVMIIGRDQSLGLAIKQLREAGFKGHVLSVNGLDQAKTWQIAGSAVDNAVFASAYVDFDSDPAVRAFNDQFQAKYGAEAEYAAVYGYTIGKYLAPILRTTGGDRAKIRAALETLDTTSLRGPLKTSPNHDIVSQSAVFRVLNGKKQIVATPTQLATAPQPAP